MADFTLDKEEIAEVKKTNPDAKKLSVKISKNVVEVIDRAPTRAEWRIFKTSLITGGQPAAGAQEALFISCCLMPKGDELNALLERFPACGDVFGVKCRELGGSAVEVSEADL